MFPGGGNCGGGGGGFFLPGGGINQIFNQFGGLLANAQNFMQNTLSSMNTAGGMIDPVQMNMLQIYTQNYLAFMQTITSLTKQVGDLDKSIANNVGS